VHEVGKLLRKVWARRGWTRRDVAVLAVASRGIWTEAERRALAGRLVSLARRATVLSDAQAAFLGALGPGPGLLILAGTGSIVIGRDTHGRWGRAGGLGPLLGDEGSAFWLGREWLRATTRGEDFLPARRLVRSADPVARIAALAPAVVRRARRGDRRARAIVRAAHRHLADQALAVARSLRLASPVSVSWAGSVLSDRWFRAGLRVALTRAGLRARWQAPAAAPVEAAVRLAATRSGSS
jgi:N-acetylglucosamine kinase-like BadF-type ATPase